MRLNVLFTGRFLPLCAAVLLLLGDSASSRLQAQSGGEPFATLSEAPEVEFAGGTDSNSPAVWDIVEGRRTLHVLNSINGGTELSAGRNLLRLQTVETVAFSTAAPPEGYWMEAVVEDPGGTWYGYYHNEVHTTACSSPDKVVPRIGAARSFDRGRTWEDLGPILEMPQAYVRCDSSNHYFLGGVGDFSVMLDADKQYLYLLYSQYAEVDGGVGVSLARMPWAARDTPAGQLAIFDAGAWLPAHWTSGTVDGESTARRLSGAHAADETASGSYTYDLAKPVFQAASRWDDGDGVVDVLWGPSIHWNTFLQSYVILMNQAVSSTFGQGGIYVSFAPDLSNPKTWSTPTELLKGGEWYPQVLGLDPGEGTDKLAGEVARFYMAGKSAYVIRFGKR